MKRISDLIPKSWYLHVILVNPFKILYGKELQWDLFNFVSNLGVVVTKICKKSTKTTRRSQLLVTRSSIRCLSVSTTDDWSHMGIGSHHGTSGFSSHVYRPTYSLECLSFIPTGTDRVTKHYGSFYVLQCRGPDKV